MATPTGSLHEMSLAELARLIKGKHVSPVEVMEATLERIEQVEPKINAFITRTPDRALAGARKAEREILNGNYRGPLHGIPVGIKDLIWTKGVPTSSGAAFERDWVPREDATVVAKLAEAGAVSVGKTNTVQFAYGGIEHDATWGSARNPWNTGRIPGGSSTGSAAALAARAVPLALGTDTGGSIRMPAAFTGVTGLKPTYGLVSRYGITAISWSLDHAGPLARTALDCAIALNALAGYDAKDAATVQRPKTDHTRGIRKGIEGLRIGVPWDYVRALWHEDVEAAFNAALRQLRSLGAHVQEVRMPELDLSGPLFPAISGTEVAELHRERLRQHAAEYHPDIRRRIETGFFVPATAYIHAQRLRRVLGQAYARTFERVDLIATPANLAPAFPIGQDTVRIRGKDEPHVEVVLRMMRITNINGLPSISVPCGFSQDGLPLSMQFIGKAWDDALVLRAGHAWQQATDWHTRVPRL